MIEIKAIIEIAGFPKEHVKLTMDTVIERIKTDKEVFVKNIKISDESQIQTVWSMFGEFDLEFENVNTFMSFCFDYTPSSIEITKPNKIDLESIDLTNLVNDLLERLHRYHLVITNLDAENKNLKFHLSNNSPQKVQQETKKTKQKK